MFILYQVTCLVNNKKYIGVHYTDRDDGYLGSGKAIKSAVKRYGKQKFIRETLETFETAEEAYYRESQIVTAEICNSNSYYNINLGGNQPPNHAGVKRNSIKYAEANRRRWANPEYRKRLSESFSKGNVKRPVMIDGVKYESMAAAGRKLGLTRAAILHRVKTGKAQYCS